MGAQTYECIDCKNKFTKPFFQGSRICRACIGVRERKRLQETVTEWQTKYRELEEKFNTLQEFVTANVGVLPPSQVERPPPVAGPLQGSPPASQEDGVRPSQVEGPHSETGPLQGSPPASQEDGVQPSQVEGPPPVAGPLQGSPPASQEDGVRPSQVERPPPVTGPLQGSPPASQEDGTRPSPVVRPHSETGPLQGSSPASQEDSFQRVRNGAKPKRPAPKLQTPTTFNRFQVLGETMEDEFETRLVGDSMVRGQLVEFCGRSSNSRRKRFCYPGAKLDDITAACDDVTKDADRNTLLIVHAGTNDVQSTRSEELLEKYRRMIRRFKSKVDASNVIISGILPRVGAEQSFYNKAFSTNNRLKTLCSQENVQFVNFWDNFYRDTFLYQTDGVHLNSVGAARFGRLLCNQVTLHKSKNVTQATPTAPP